MPELKIIPTITQTTISGTNISIKTYYDENILPDTIMCDIANIVSTQDGTPYIEGEGIIEMKNSPSNIDYVLDGNGNLILLISTGDESKYSIDSNGNLIYTF